MLWYRMCLRGRESIGQGLLCMLEEKRDSAGKKTLELNFCPREEREGGSPIGVNTLSLILDPVKSP